MRVSSRKAISGVATSGPTYALLLPGWGHVRASAVLSPIGWVAEAASSQMPPVSENLLAN
jgi:hypothetical protein